MQSKKWVCSVSLVWQSVAKSSGVGKPSHGMLGLKWQSENLTLVLKTPVLLLNFYKCPGEINVKVLRKPYTQARNCYYYFIVC